MSDRKESSKKYYEKNREEILQKHKIWRDNNIEHVKEYRKNYYKKNSQKISEYHKARREKLATEQYECPCGSVILKASLKSHEKSIHHRNFFNED
jgi:hypothetical protein